MKRLTILIPPIQWTNLLKHLTEKELTASTYIRGLIAADLKSKPTAKPAKPATEAGIKKTLEPLILDILDKSKQWLNSTELAEMIGEPATARLCYIIGVELVKAETLQDNGGFGLQGIRFASIDLTPSLVS